RFAGTTQAFAVDRQLTGELKRLAEEHGGTLFMVLLAAFKVLLYRYTGQDDISVGTPIANRQYGETEGLIGMFVNTLVLRDRVEGGDTFSGFLAQVRATCVEAYEHQDAPFEKIVDMLCPQRNPGISPLFQVMLVMQNADIHGLDHHVKPHPLESGISKFDLTVEFTETTDGLAGLIEYSTALHKRETMERMVQHFLSLCRVITATPTARIRDLGYIGETEKHKLLIEFNDTEANYPRDKCIHELFAGQVAANPGKTAVVFGQQQLSYQELNDKCSDLALYLQSLGVTGDSVVALCLERSLEMMIAV